MANGTPTGTSEAWAVLKMRFEDEIRRVPLKGLCEFKTVEEALDGQFSNSKHPLDMLYITEEGREHLLTETTFLHFLSTARPNGHPPLLKVTVKKVKPLAQEAELSATVEGGLEVDEEAIGAVGGESSDAFEVDVGAPSPADACEAKLEAELTLQEQDASDLDQREALNMVERARQACEEVLSNHLQEWLASKPSPVTFEAWLAAVHPENLCRSQTDPRMYLESSFHRQLWNQMAAGAADICEQERARRFILPRQDKEAPDSAQTAAPLLPELVPALSQRYAALETNGNSRTDASATDGTEPVWKQAVVQYVAHVLPLGALVLRDRKHQTDLAHPGVPGEFRAEYRQLAKVLGGMGDEFRSVAAAANDLATGMVFLGTGVFRLTSRAAQLSHEDRLRYAGAFCDHCPQRLSFYFPQFDMAPGTRAQPQAVRVKAPGQVQRQRRHEQRSERDHMMQLGAEVRQLNRQAESQLDSLKKQSGAARSRTSAGTRDSFDSYRQELLEVRRAYRASLRGSPVPGHGQAQDAETRETLREHLKAAKRQFQADLARQRTARREFMEQMRAERAEYMASRSQVETEFRLTFGQTVANLRALHGHVKARQAPKAGGSASAGSSNPGNAAAPGPGTGPE